ncbi:hypothetical protein VB618_10165, partial [Microvirga sp. CF3062]|uniref:hypothetical protein n=1 Tax=Microvirga sp. CF3062 TaxID=3110182 RepID=UPI002E7975D8
SMYLTAIVANRPQGHRRLRFSSPLNNVKEHVSVETGKNLTHPGSPCRRPEPEAFPAATPQNRAVDEPYLGEVRTDVNSIRQEFESSSRTNTAAAQVQTQNSRSQK